jgi:hypothetical protein
VNRLFLILILCSLGYGSQALGNSDVDECSVEDCRAKFHYQIFCQGCHSEDGVGHKSVPDLRESMSQFMRFEEGRQFMVQVPGSANSVLSNEQLAEVLNWMVSEFSSNKTWRDYSAAEVAEYRKTPLLQTEQLRAELVKRFSTK